MVSTVSQRELRNDNAVIMRRVEAGETFTITRNGRPIADLNPHREPERTRPAATMADLQEEFRRLPAVDKDAWAADMAEADEIFGPDDPLDSPVAGTHPNSRDRASS